MAGAAMQAEALQQELADYKQRYQSTKADFEQVGLQECRLYQHAICIQASCLLMPASRSVNFLHIVLVG